MPQQFQENQQGVQNQVDSGLLMSALGGGLNTTSSRLNTPPEDSPDLLNVVVTQSATVKKRPGTFVRAITGSPAGATLVPMALPNGTDIIVAKEGKDINVYEFTETSMSSVCLISNVWSAAAESVRASYVTTSESNPRIIFCTGVNVPVQLTIAQSSGVGNGTTSVTFVEKSFAGIPDATFIRCSISNGALQQPASYSFNSSTNEVTLTFVGAVSNGASVYVVAFIWQWWGEALKLNGDQLYQHTTKFHAISTDQNVAIPASLLPGVEEISYGIYPIRAWKSGSYVNQSSLPGTEYNFQTDRIPAASDLEYCFSSGGRYDPSVNAEIVPSLSHITFGQVKTGTPTPAPESVHFIRGISLPFAGGDGVLGQELLVQSGDNPYNKTTYSQNTNITTAGAGPTKWYYLRTSAYALINNSNSTAGKFITFDAQTPLGVPATTTVWIMHNKVPSAYVGSSATTSTSMWDLKPGSCVPVFGISSFCDYSGGSFPRVCSLFQNRLVLASFPLAPLSCVLSNVLDTTTPGIFYNNFQTDLETGATVDAVDVFLSSTLDDYITALVDFNNNLFVFTKRSSWRIHNSSGSVTPTTTQVNFVANLGCVNQQSVSRVGRTIYFLSPQGLYDVIPTQDSADYSQGDAALKIRSLISTDRDFNESAAWILHDQTTETVYLGLGRSDQPYAAEDLFVYNTLRESWVKWEFPCGRFFTTSSCLLQTSDGKSRVFLLGGDYVQYPSKPTFGQYLTLDQDHFLDLAHGFTHSGSTTYNTAKGLNIVAHRVTLTTKPEKFEYKVSIGSASVNSLGFSMLPVSTVGDARVYLDGNELTFGEEWTKKDSETIVLLVPPGDGRTLLIEQLDEFGNYPIVVYKNNVLLEQGVDYTASVVSGYFSLVIPGAQNTDYIKIGTSYKAYHQTPMFCKATISNIKRFLSYFGYYQNNSALIQAEETQGTQTYEEIVDEYRQKVGFNISFLYDDNMGGFDSTTYGFSDLYWDDALFDAPPSYFQYRPHSVVKEALQGMTYGFQVMTWNFSPYTFEIVGYEVKWKTKGWFPGRVTTGG